MKRIAHFVPENPLEKSDHIADRYVETQHFMLQKETDLKCHLW
jgi:hypothetical protein